VMMGDENSRIFFLLSCAWQLTNAVNNTMVKIVKLAGIMFLVLSQPKDSTANCQVTLGGPPFSPSLPVG